MVDWARVFEEAVSHSVHLLVYDCLTEQERAAIPKETAVPWRQEVLSAMWYNEQLLGEPAGGAEGTFRAPLRDLEGQLLCRVLSTAGAARAGDIDLLILPADLEKAEAILSAGATGRRRTTIRFTALCCGSLSLWNCTLSCPASLWAPAVHLCGNTSKLLRKKEFFAAAFRPAARNVSVFAVAPQAGACHKQRTGAAAALRLGGVCPP